MIRKKLHLSDADKEYVERMKRHPFVVPVSTFLVLFFITLISVIIFNGRDVVPSDSHVIELSMDGTKQSIPTRASTVGEFLERANITLGEKDIVEPAKDTTIYDEELRINVYRARPVTIVEENGLRTFAYSAATTPRSVVQQAGVTVYPEDNLSSEVPDNFLREGVLGEKVVIDRSTPVNINLYGTHVPLRTHAKTVAEFLKEKNVQLSKDDTVQPAPTTLITPEIQVFVLRSGTQIATAEEAIPMPLEYIEDSSLSAGSQAVRQAGAPGKKVVTYQIELVNSKEVSRKKIQEVIASPPIKQIVARGPQSSFGQALARLRQCEAGGNYAINTGNGFYGAYQFNVSTWNGYGGFTYPSDAPAGVQDQKATETYQRRGWQPWPGCTKKLGLQDTYR
ncbi:MAG TPA: ubiquitin-like domain-containing protein [Verrucomicrobiae bacterium]|nr:ubiquitin-like domain-containing protein [Verrucomicrobiae bacterium]